MPLTASVYDSRAIALLSKRTLMSDMCLIMHEYGTRYNIVETAMDAVHVHVYSAIQDTALKCC